MSKKEQFLSQRQRYRPNTSRLSEKAVRVEADMLPKMRILIEFPELTFARISLKRK